MISRGHPGDPEGPAGRHEHESGGDSPGPPGGSGAPSGSGAAGGSGGRSGSGGSGGRGGPGGPGVPGGPGGAPVEAALERALSAARRGDEQAFRTVYRDVQPKLLRYLQSLVGADADDVSSDAWLQISRDLHTFQGDYDRFRGWASIIARNRAIDHIRRAARRPSDPTPVEDLLEVIGQHDTERDALDRVSADRAVALIATLPRDQAEAVLLRVVIGLEAKEVARVLGKRPGAVRDRKSVV